MALTRAAEVLLPLAGLAAALPALRWFFKDTWRELDEDAQREATERRAAGRTDPRPLVAFVTVAVVLTMLQYYGGFEFYRDSVQPMLVAREGEHSWIRLGEFAELYALGWWIAMRVVGFVLVPLGVNRVLARTGLAAGFGLGARGFVRHAWIGGSFLAVVLPLLWLASRDPDFVRVYPNYQSAGRSGLDLLLWETMYVGQFLALEMFLRGWLLGMLRGLGSGAIFALTVPYCMMHFAGKPYAETIGSIAAGIALGSLAAKTKSIWQGFLIHGVVALAMDLLALAHRGQLPRVFWAAV